MERSRGPSRAWRPWWLVPLVLGVSACTKILGIDGTYGLDDHPTQSGGPSEPDAAADVNTAMGGTATAIVDAGRGGTAGAGGNGVDSDAHPADGDTGAGGALADSGCVSCCKPGSYEGSFTGTHAPQITFVGVPLPVSGTVSLTASGSSPQLDVRGTFSGTIGSTCTPGMTGSCPFPGGPFEETLVGTLDCHKQQVTGSIIAGTIVNAPGITLVGTFTASFVGPGALSGNWSEQESPGPAVQITPQDGTGSGSWVATPN